VLVSELNALPESFPLRAYSILAEGIIEGDLSKCQEKLNKIKGENFFVLSELMEHCPTILSFVFPNVINAFNSNPDPTGIKSFANRSVSFLWVCLKIFILFILLALLIKNCDYGEPSSPEYETYDDKISNFDYSLPDYEYTPPHIEYKHWDEKR